MNLTLSIDKRVLDQARKAAQDLGLSVNELVRRYLEKVAGMSSPAAHLPELRRLFLEQGGHSKGQRISRDDLQRG